MRRRVRRSVNGVIWIRQQHRRSPFPALGSRKLRVSETAEIIHAQCVALARRDNLKAHYDFLLFARRDRKNSRAEQAVPHPLEQCGIALASHYFLIDAARTVGVHRLAGNHLAVDRELQVLERSAFWQGEHVVCFANAGTAIDKGFSYLVTQNAIDEIDADVAALPVDIRRLNSAGRDLASRARCAFGYHPTRPGTRRRSWPDDLGGGESGDTKGGDQDDGAHLSPVERVYCETPPTAFLAHP